MNERDVERVARGIAIKIDHYDNWHSYVDIARAAIEAMKPVVTDEMVERALNAWYRQDIENSTKKIMRAALEAALEVKP